MFGFFQVGCLLLCNKLAWIETSTPGNSLPCLDKRLKLRLGREELIVPLPSRNRDIVLLQNDFILFGIYIFAMIKASLE